MYDNGRHFGVNFANFCKWEQKQKKEEMENEKKKKTQKEKNLKPPNETSFTLVDPMHQLASTPLFDLNFPIYFIAREHKK